MSSSRVILGIDIGSTKIATVVGEVLPSRGLVLRALYNVPTQAVARGIIRDMNQACDDINNSYAGAMYSSGISDNNVFVGISGREIEGVNTRSEIEFDAVDHEVDEVDLETVLDRAMPRSLEEGKQIVHSLVRGYVLDGIRVSRTPLGMIGRRLEVEAHVVIGGATQLSNIQRAIDRVDLEIESFVYNLIAAGECVLSQEDRNAGCILIDIGGGTTKLGIYYGGTLVYSACLPVGGQNYDQDLKQGLGVSFEEAQRVKKSYGRAWIDAKDDELEEFVDVKFFGRKEYDKVKRRRIYEIMQPRTEEMVDWITESIRQSELLPRIAGGVVITGGGAQLRELRRFLQKQVGKQVRLGIPAGVGNLLDEYRSPAYAATLGLLHYGHKYEPFVHKEQGNFFGEVVEALGDIMGGLFKRGEK